MRRNGTAGLTTITCFFGWVPAAGFKVAATDGVGEMVDSGALIGIEAVVGVNASGIGVTAGAGI